LRRNIAVLDMTFVSTNGVLLRYHLEGNGPRYGLIMGYRLHGAVWPDLFVDRLAQRFSVLTFDNRCTGLSDKPAQGMVCTSWRWTSPASSPRTVFDRSATCSIWQPGVCIQAYGDPCPVQAVAQSAAPKSGAVDFRHSHPNEKRPQKRGALPRCNSQAAILAVRASRTTPATGLPVTGITRGLIASGTTRTSSRRRSPFSKFAPCT
jgi:hypothetical protein